jgi:hypothetical protein
VRRHSSEVAQVKRRFAREACAKPIYAVSIVLGNSHFDAFAEEKPLISPGVPPFAVSIPM